MKKNITSPTHPLIKHLVSLRKDRKTRKEHGETLLLGRKILCDLSGHLDIKEIYYVNPEDIPESFASFPQVQLSKDLVKKITNLPAPEPFLARVELPKEVPLSTTSPTLVLDRLADPGNLGTLLRAAACFSFSQVILLTPCVDPFNDKTLRAAKGANFLLDLHEMEESAFKNFLGTSSLTPVLAHTQAPPLSSLKTLNSPPCLILGQESEGPSSLLQELSSPYSLKIAAPMESLNVAQAGGIFLYHLAQIKELP